MKRAWASVATVSTTAVLATTAGAAPPPTAGPSERACLLAWNAKPNAAGRQRLLSSGPWRVAVLRPAARGHLQIGAGARPPRTESVCLLMLVRQGRLQFVSGRWRDGAVREWAFERPLPVDDGPQFSNVRILSDGRVSKLYRR